MIRTSSMKFMIIGFALFCVVEERICINLMAGFMSMQALNKRGSQHRSASPDKFKSRQRFALQNLCDSLCCPSFQLSDKAKLINFH